jgi:hypothetical protein
LNCLTQREVLYSPLMILLGPEAIPYTGNGEPGCAWFVAAVGTDRGLSVESTVGSLAALANHRFDVFIVLDPRTRAVLDGALSRVIDEFSTGTSRLIFLLPWQPAPETHVRDDGPVYSFACSASILLSLLRARRDFRIEKLSFDILSAVADGTLEVDRLLVRQFPSPDQPSLVSVEPPSAAVIMAHRGKPAHLATALRYLHRAARTNMNIRVGLDVDELSEYQNLLLAYPDVEFYRTCPAALGPYVIRDELSSLSPESLFLFHDSDDLSCNDRFPTLYAGMMTSGCDLMGSHELKLDEIECEVDAFRFPLDVSDALRREIAHPLQHPTSMVRRDAFLRAGGFSTDRRISNDTQFLLRAHFSMRIRNVDAFVYIRRKHVGALTEAPDTGMHMPIRHLLKQTWSADFRAVQRGELQLNDSSLRRIEGDLDYQFERVFPLPSEGGSPVAGG